MHLQLLDFVGRRFGCVRLYFNLIFHGQDRDHLAARKENLRARDGDLGDVGDVGGGQKKGSEFDDEGVPEVNQLLSQMLVSDLSSLRALDLPAEEPGPKDPEHESSCLAFWTFLLTLPGFVARGFSRLPPSW